MAKHVRSDILVTERRAALACLAQVLVHEQLDSVTIRFAGDSGDGMQLTGSRFTSETAVIGNDLSTLPDFPAEIRAPAGTLAGVSAFQIHISDHDILTPGDVPSVLIAMNPAALKANIGDLAVASSAMISAAVRNVITGRLKRFCGMASTR